jgi:hypothetical protein
MKKQGKWGFIHRSTTKDMMRLIVRFWTSLSLHPFSKISFSSSHDRTYRHIAEISGSPFFSPHGRTVCTFLTILVPSTHMMASSVSFLKGWCSCEEKKKKKKGRRLVIYSHRGSERHSEVGTEFSEV